MASILFTPLIPVSQVNTKSRRRISMKAHGCLR
ncbi:hypothetical protein SUGI_0725690, partial [Cryptomeria japonica]